MEASLLNKSDRKDKAVSPAISTVVLASTIIVMLIVALAYANNLLSSKTAESDFNSAKQFMQTIGLQVDDVAWTIGRTETVRYSSRYGQMELLPQALKYTIQYQNESGMHTLVEYEVGILLFNIPLSQYSVSDDYYEQIFPSSNSFVQTGASAPVVRVVAVEWLQSGSFIRVVVAPCIRLLNSPSGYSPFYVRLYLPLLTLGSAPRSAQSVTLTGSSVNTITRNHVTSINVTVSFPKSGFDNSFFHFSNVYETIIPEEENSVLEFYAATVTASLGAHA